MGKNKNKSSEAIKPKNQITHHSSDLLELGKTCDSKISVIIPVYNAEKYLHQCLDSVLKQTFKNIEVICIDDNSSDSSLQILKEYSQKDHRIIIKANTENLHAGVCRNQGITIASGDFIHFLDADDWLELNAYEKLHSIASQHESEIYLFMYNKYDNVTQETECVKLFDYITGTKTNFNENFKFLLNTSVVPWNKLFKRNYIIENNLKFDDLVCANDRFFYVSSIMKAKEICFINEYLINYRINNSNSLVGRGRVNNYKCHIVAYLHMRDISTDFTYEQKKALINSTMIDLLTFYHNNNTPKTYSELCGFLEEYKSDFKFLENDLPSYSWSAEYYAIQHFNSINTSEFEDHIPIVFSTNDNYAPYLGVAIDSLIVNSNKNYYYDIFVLYTELSNCYIQKLSSISQYNISVTCLNINALVSQEIKHMYSLAHYSKEMYYRIMIPDIFHQLDKALYLDCDLVVLDDVYNLYSIDFEDNFLIGIQNASNKQMESYIRNVLRINSEQYINSGVMLINCNKFRVNNLKKECFSLLQQSNKFVCPDQDILNIACKNKIKLIESNWNFQWHGLVIEADIEMSEIYYSNLVSASEDIKILHFTSFAKAWNSPSAKYANIFWEYAYKNIFFIEILCKNVDRIICGSFFGNEQVGLEKKLNEAIKQRDFYVKELDATRNSMTYKIGEFITYLPRKIRRNK